MKVANNILYKVLSFACALMLIVACNDDTTFTGEGETVPVTFHPTMVGTRTIGDAANIDKLTVVAYEGNDEKLRISQDWATAQLQGVTLTLLKGVEYNILLWAECSDNSAYTISENCWIKADYTAYLNATPAKMEQLDAFCATATVTVGYMNKEVKHAELSRPFAQLNILDKSVAPTQGVHKAEVTFHTIPTAFNPFTGEVETTDSSNDADDITFVFGEFSNETLNIDGKEHYYIASNYLFASGTEETTVEATIAMPFQNVTPIKTFVFKEQTAIMLGTNKRTNVIGTFLTPYNPAP